MIINLVFISRYLVGFGKDDFDIDAFRDFQSCLIREEFWPSKFMEKEEQILEDLNVLKKENLNVDECYELYKLLGGDKILVYEDIKNK